MDSAVKRIFIGGQNPSGTIFASQKSGLRFHLGQYFEILHKLEDLSVGDFYLALDISPKELRRVRKLGVERKHRALIAFEPQVVLPWQRVNLAEREFSKVIWMGRTISENSEFWPQIMDFTASTGERRSEPAMVFSNKLSFNRGELYQLRRESVRRIPGLALAGSGWDLPFSRRWLSFTKELLFTLRQGRLPESSNLDYFWTHRHSKPVPNKIEWLSQFKVSLVIENSIEYSSEKLFDSLRALSVPIYVGARQSLPHELEKFILRAEPNLDSIMGALALAETLNYESWRIQLLDTLTSSALRLAISEDEVFERLARSVETWSKG